LRKFRVDFDEKVFRELDKDPKKSKHNLPSISQSGSHSRMDTRRKQNDVQSSSDA
jgi:hypothetical protein